MLRNCQPDTPLHRPGVHRLHGDGLARAAVRKSGMHACSGSDPSDAEHTMGGALALHIGLTAGLAAESHVNLCAWRQRERFCRRSAKTSAAWQLSTVPQLTYVMITSSPSLRRQHYVDPLLKAADGGLLGAVELSLVMYQTRSLFRCGPTLRSLNAGAVIVPCKSVC